jgi:peptidoglycan/LPS O-acetylase OafA/YrhL
MKQEPWLNLVINRPVRRHDFDWLKVAATLAVFLFHCLRFFDLGSWHVKNNELDAIADILARILLQWIMPLFFLLSGASIYFALQFRTAGQFLRERCRRLIIPLLLGILILSPPQIYLERLSNPQHGVAPWNGGLQFSGSFWEFVPYYFQGWYLLGGNFAWMGVHLWYLLVLLLFSLLLLPIFLAIRSRKAQLLMEPLGVALEHPGGIFLLGIPIAILESGLDPATIGFRLAGGWNLFTYCTLLLYGYLIVFNPRIEQAIHHHVIPALAIAGCTTPLWLATRHWLMGQNLDYGSAGYTLVITLQSFNSWCWIVAFLSLGKKFLSLDSPALRYMSQASLPFYMLHQPIILIIGFLIAEWQVGVLPKFIVLSSVAFAAIALLYELLIRRIGLLRVFFGLKPK